jgi:hypothetical protein
MMAMPFTSARPVEYDAFLPNSLQLDTHAILDGPYQITSYAPGQDPEEIIQAVEQSLARPVVQPQPATETLSSP